MRHGNDPTYPEKEFPVPIRLKGLIAGLLCALLLPAAALGGIDGAV